MKTHRLGRNGPELPALGLGCMGMSPLRPQPGRHDAAQDGESIATIQAALDAGLRLINTGDFYGMGHNELLVREALRDQPLGSDISPRAVKNFCSYSLDRLDTEVIDLYQPGRVPTSVPIEDTMGAIAELIQEGKVRHLGLSEVTGDQLRRAHALHPVTAVELEYSLAGRAIEDDLLPVARQLGVGIVACSVAAQGLLAVGIKGASRRGRSAQLDAAAAGRNADRKPEGGRAVHRVRAGERLDPDAARRRLGPGAGERHRRAGGYEPAWPHRRESVGDGYRPVGGGSCRARQHVRARRHRGWPRRPADPSDVAILTRSQGNIA